MAQGRAYQSRKGDLGNEQVGPALVTSNLPQGDRAGTKPPSLRSRSHPSSLPVAGEARMRLSRLPVSKDRVADAAAASTPDPQAVTRSTDEAPFPLPLYSCVGFGREMPGASGKEARPPLRS
jgi:hypothetical protein